MQLAGALDLVRGNQTVIKKNIGVPILVMALLSMVIFPLPPILLDVLFSFNISLALVILLVSVYTQRPLDFAAFPTVLLLATLLRLGLNVASTRVVLLNGHEGEDAAGKVIEAFGEVVIGGNYTVGIIVFAILMIINFIVITKGAGRISEVSARFTLDAMPGKQMAIDADLNAGLIDQVEARTRREEITRESDFYGAMDGASKFVRGDAIAGMAILAINIVGGLLIGTLQYQLSLGEAAEIYTLLTIGDGLVAQIPSLLISVAAAIIITRQKKSQNMGEAVMGQLFANPSALVIASGILLVMGLIPGMPHFAFLLLGTGSSTLCYYLIRKNKEAARAQESEKKQAIAAQTKSREMRDLGWEDVQPVDVIGLEVGYHLIPLVDRTQGGELLARIRGVRKKLSQELGFLIPAVHVRDNLDMTPNTYSLSLMGVRIGSDTIYPDRQLAINPGQVFGTVQGIKSKDPAFGLDAIWVTKEQTTHAQTLGYTVVDAATVIATHVSQLLQQHASLLLGHEEAQNLLDLLSRQHPKLVESIIPEPISLGVMTKVMQNLLEEGVPVRDMRTLLQAVAEYAPKSVDPDILTAAARIALRRLIVQEIAGNDKELPVITLAPELENLLHQSMQSGGEQSGLEPGLAERMQASLNDAVKKLDIEGKPTILLTSGVLRSTMARFVKPNLPTLKVLSYQEVPEDKEIRIVSTVGQG